ncbi:CCA tRNA nucleotidyltransferase 1, mitochondrial-like [Prorops nasuta]|uniref:CCA tRNA nucleotidyltransferase 1, mitochondrial-like n=1 Tax=Prorops nasuta TaxID=863751 RepID=UPI0034CEC112
MNQPQGDPVIKTLNMDYYAFTRKPEYKKLVKLFEDYDFELRIAGGAVRDILSGISSEKINDIDFATNATTEQMRTSFEANSIKMVHPKGEEHGTITAKINVGSNENCETYEITTLGSNSNERCYNNNKWKIDASLRDFTINSMFLDLNGNVYDYCGGYNDLKKGKVAFIGNPAARIKECPILIFRYFRFYGRFSQNPDKHDQETIDAIRNNAFGLKDVHGQHIRSEWEKILKGRYGCEMTLKLIECGVAQYCGLPQHPNTEEFKKIYRLQSSSHEFNLKKLLYSLLWYEDQKKEVKDRLYKSL